jgi:hypothetical protein
MEKLSPDVDGSSEDLWLVLKNGELNLVALPWWNWSLTDFLDAYCKPPHKLATPEIDRKIWWVLEWDIAKNGTYKAPKRR